MAQALEAFAEAAQHVVSDHDKSAVEASRADALLMLGRVGEAIDAYEVALEHAPYRLNLYLPLTGAYRERGGMGAKEWRALVEVIEKTLVLWGDRPTWPSSVVSQ